MKTERTKYLLRKNLIPALLLGLSGLLISCGGGSSSSDPVTDNPPPVGGVVRSGIAYGPIDGFGSVIVNGIHYDTSNASFTIDDAVGSETDLKVGQVVTLKTETDDQGNASASEVIFDDEVQGPIEVIDLVNSSLVVLGQMILVDGNTSFDDSISPANLEGLVVGDVVEVSGLVNADSMIIASRIELKSAMDEYEVHGVISALDSGALTFMLNDLTVDYSGATLDDYGSATPADGDLVEVKGTNFTTNGALIASEVELENNDDRVGDDDDDAEIEGIIDVFTSAESFSVAGIPVITNSSTEFEYGSASDLALNVRVEVEGTFNASGELVADKVEIEDEANIEVSSTVDTVDAANNTFTIYGIVFVVDTSTRFEDKTDAGLEPFDLSNISAGEYLEVAGLERDGQLYASRVERDEFDSESEIQGPVDSIAGASLVILGVTIDTDTNTQYQDFDDSRLSQTEFFGLVTVGSIVSASGDKTANNAMLAEELEFED